MLDLSYIQNQSDNINIFTSTSDRINSINRTVLVSSYAVQSTKTYTGTPTNFVAGQRYRIRFRYGQATGGGVFQVKWSKPNTPTNFTLDTTEILETKLETRLYKTSTPAASPIDAYDKIFNGSNLLWAGNLPSSVVLNLPSLQPLLDAGEGYSGANICMEAVGTFIPLQTGAYTFQVTVDDSMDILIEDIDVKEQWQTWTKPRNKCSFIYMMCMSGGAGGSGGSNSSFGNGGASGAITTALFPASVLPDNLYILVGKGGIGGAGANNSIGVPATPAIKGSQGTLSMVAVSPVTTSFYVYPGTAGLICSSGNGLWKSSDFIGEVGNTPSLYLPTLISLGSWSSVNGRDRASGNVTPLLGGTITCPGADGGGSSTLIPVAGSSIVSVNLGNNIVTPFIEGGGGGAVEGSSGNRRGGRGRDGIWNWNPLFGTGGAGGGGNNQESANAGNGGNGAYGCGGGGGGCGTNIAGAGGNGGDGLVIIATF